MSVLVAFAVGLGAFGITSLVFAAVAYGFRHPRLARCPNCGGRYDLDDYDVVLVGELQAVECPNCEEVVA
mgnify:CR=1 FL=1